MNTPVWILVTWFVTASVPEHYGYKGYTNHADCQEDMVQIIEDISQITRENTDFAMTCVETHGRDPDILAKIVAAGLKKANQSNQKIPLTPSL